MSDDQDQPRRGGDAGTERALDELRVALEQLATRMGAGFREDLAQIRAIAASVAERDLTADIEALRVDVATLVGRDGGTELRDEVAALRTEVARLASGDGSTGAESGLASLQASVDRISARLDDDSGRTQVLARFEALESRLDQLGGGDGSAEVLARIDALSARVDAMPDARQISNLPADLRAHLADALAGFDGDSITRELAGVRSQLGGGHGSLLEQLQDNLADVASGEVVGALWDEVRQLRTDLPDLVAAPAPEPVALEREPDPQLASLTDELSVLRTELAEGLVVEPSDALSASLDDLKVEIDALRTALAGLDTTPSPAAADDGRDEQVLEELAALRAAIDGVRSRVDALPDTVPAPVVADDGRDEELLEQLAAVRTAVDGVQSRVDLLPLSAPEPVVADTGPDEQVLEQLDTIRTAVDEVRSRLDEAPLALGDPVPTGADMPENAGVEALADQVAAMRDFVASELETLRQTIATRLDAAAEATAATVAAAASRTEPAPAAEVQATVDPEAIESLRDEIRASGAIADQVIDALREELKAVRRRIAVKAAERVLDDQQLAQIADAVAARLAEDRGDA